MEVDIVGVHSLSFQPTFFENCILGYSNRMFHRVD